MLVSFYKNDISLKVIDHTHVFINQALWDAACLKRAMSENDLTDTRVIEYNNYLYNMFIHNISIKEEALKKESLLFKRYISNDIILKLIDSIPYEWKPRQEDIEALVEYIMYRINNLDKIISMILKHIK